jgi:hypothetical protein
VQIQRRGFALACAKPLQFRGLEGVGGETQVSRPAVYETTACCPDAAPYGKGPETSGVPDVQVRAELHALA